MDTVSLPVLFSILFILIFLSAFFSSSETGMMALNRYRLRHLARDKHRGAMLVQTLLERPDRLLGLILIGNNIVNIFATSVVTIIAVRLLGPAGYGIGPALLIPIILIFAETAPKTYAALHPEKIAFPAARLLKPLLRISYPFIFTMNKISNSLLIPLGVKSLKKNDPALSQEELRTLVHEAGPSISGNYQSMLLSILDMENVTVDDIMVPRNELIGLNIDEPVGEIIEQLAHCQHTRLIIYRENIDNIVGMLHTRHVLSLLNQPANFSSDELKKLVTEPYYIPEGTPLHTQMLKFQQQKQRVGLVVDEYGMVQGMATLDDILEEIIGKFTTDLQTFNQDIQSQGDGSYFIHGSTAIRTINKQLGWHLPSGNTKTINGLILEHLENIPEPGTSLRIDDYTFEITQVVDNAVKKVKVMLLQKKPDLTAVK